jgi:hypothetical protein
MHSIAGWPAQDVCDGSSRGLPDDIEAGNLEGTLDPRLAGKKEAESFNVIWVRP